MTEAKQEDGTKKLNLALILGGLFFTLYAIAYTLPEKWWGLHHGAFLNPTVKWFIFLLAAVCLMYGGRKVVLDRLNKLKAFKWWAALIIAIVAGWLLHTFPIHNDFYGDAPRHMEFLGEQVTELNEERVNHMYDLNVFDTKIGEITVLNFVEKMSYEQQVNPKVVFQWIGTVCGALFIFLWSLFVPKYLGESKNWITIWGIGLLAPFLQLFSGHIEIYAPVIVASSAFLMALLMYIQSGEKKWMWVMIPLLFLSLKFHFASILLIPAFAGAILFVNSEKVKSLLTLKNAIYFVVLPIVLIGWVAYIVVFKDYNDPRFLNGTIEDGERLFLPILSPEAPLDRYNLFSLNHILDYINMFFLWSAAGLLMLVYFLIRRSRMNWDRPEVVILICTLILYAGLFFMINPLISMPMDFDLFSIPAPILLMVAVALWKNKKHEEESLTGPIWGLGILTLAIFATNASPMASSKRLESLGKHTFKTYWIRSIGNLQAGLEMADEEHYIERLHKAIDDLRPYAIQGKDLEYANLVWRAGKYYRDNNDLGEALQWHLEAEDYFKNYPVNVMGTMDAYYRMGEFQKAYDKSKVLLDIGYPSKERAFKMAIDCGLRAEHMKDVEEYCKQYLQLYPRDQFINDALAQLGGPTNPEDKSLSPQVLMDQLKGHFVKKDFNKAYEAARQLIAVGYPDKLTAISMGIHCALEAEMYTEAEKLCVSFLELQPNDPTIGPMLKRLQKGENLDQLKELFTQRQRN